MQKVISQTENGKTFRCSSCNKIHIEFNNLNFNFDEEEFENFAGYIESLDGEYWESINQDSNYQRKIILKIGHQNVNMLFNIRELEELKHLLNNSGKQASESYISGIKDFNLHLLLN